ncbi:MAG: ribbon-helix-helix domain-containing protein [Pseudomonadota bacterium]
MATAKIAITLDERTLDRLDLPVRDRVFPNRSKAGQKALEEKLENLERNNSPAGECAKLDPAAEKAMAEEGMGEVLQQWPEY